MAGTGGDERRHGEWGWWDNVERDGRFTRPLTDAQRDYLAAFDVWLKDDFGNSEDAESSLDKAAALNAVLLEANLEPWEVLGPPRRP